MKRLSFLCFVIALSVVSFAQRLPDRLADWTRTDSATYLPGVFDRIPDKRTESFIAYGVEKVHTAVYERGKYRLAVLIARTSSYLTSFGLFGLLCGGDFFTGIMGNAFLQRDGRTILNYGPFVCELTLTGSRRRGNVPESVIIGLKKTLYTWSDCDSDDPPLPVSERVLGSERFIEGAAIWRTRPPAYLLPVLDVIDGKSAFTALYRKAYLRIERRLIAIPVSPDKEKKLLLENLSGIYGRQWSSFENECGINSFRSANTVVYLTEAPDAVLLAVTDIMDPGCCFWVRDVASGKYGYSR